MSDLRTVYIDAEDVAAIEAGGYALIREEQNGPGIRLMALALKWREMGQPVFSEPQVDFKITGYSGLAEPPVAVVPGAAELTERETRGVVVVKDGSEWPPRPRSVSFATGAFTCSADDIDESAGLAEVVELRGYSRKTPA